MSTSREASGRLALLAIVIAAVAAGACSDAPAGPASPPLTATSTAPAAILVGAGNVARCDGSNDEATARLLDEIAGTVFTTGDNVYASGSSSDFSSCYGPSWGRHKGRTRPAAGEREYQTSGAAGYFGYFGSAAGEAGRGYYSYDLGEWHVVVLNSGVDMRAGSAQEQWLQVDLAASGKRCTVAYWHYPRFSSYSTYMRAEVKPLWNALYAAGVEVVVNGHYRIYERFAPQTPEERADAATGIRQFTVGTGGQGVDAFGTPRPNSEVRHAGAHGVLQLRLHAGGYSWRFLPVAGESFTDAGSGACHDPAGTPLSDDEPQGAVASLDVSPSTASLEAGKTVQLSARLADAGGNELTGRSVTWSSSATGVATVSSSGLVTGVGVGSATITATSEGQKGTASVTVTAPSGTGARVGYYAAPNGSSSGDGSIDRPWDLRTALAGGSGRVGAGDTVWLRGGSYRGAFVSSVAGTSGRPVVVRQYPGERAVIDGAGTSSSTFQVRGDWSVFWGLELTNSDPNRVSSSTSSHSRANTVVNYASHTKYVHLVVHDGGVGFYTDPNALDVEIVGSIFYNNGWQGPDRGHGHALYLKSYTGPVVARDNVMFNQFGYGVHAYTNSGSGKLNNIHVLGNVAFNNGTLSTNSTSPNILLGGADDGTGDVVAGNLTYYTPGVGGTNVKIGYGTVRNGTVVVDRNLIVGGSRLLDLGYWSSASVTANTIVGSAGVLRQNNTSTSGYTFAGNRHWRSPSATAWWYGGSDRTFSGWKSATGLGAADQALSGTPGTPQVFVQPSPYEAGRATVVVYNWARQGSITVNLAGVLGVGERYEVRNVQDLFGPPVASGTHGGSIILPLGGATPPAPVGMSSSRAPRTGPDFDVFIVVVRPD